MKSKTSLKIQKKQRRHNRVRAKVFGTPAMPRLSVFKSINYIYAQLIDDENHRTLVAFSEAKLPVLKEKTSAKIKKAFEVGRQLAFLAKKNGIQKVVFDRGGYRYHGRIKSLADGAREGGLIF